MARSTFPSQNAKKKPQRRTTFGSLDVEKVDAVVARSTFPSQNAQNPAASEHFWKLRCRKSARRCGAKQMSKSKCTKHTRFGALFEVEMSKKWTLLWGEAHFQVKMHKAAGSEHFLKLRTLLWRGAHFQVKMHKAPGSEHFLKLRTPLWRGAHFQVKMFHMFGPLLGVQMSLRVAGARDCARCQKSAKCEGFVAVSKALAGVGHLKRICKDASSVAGAVQETCSSAMLGGPGAHFLRMVAFWSMRSSVLPR